MEKPNINTEYNKKLQTVHDLDEEALRLYKHPENQEEMIEGMRLIKEIPEAINTPKVLVKLSSPDKADKFVYMKDGDGREYFIALPIDDKGYHREIVNFARKLYAKDFTVDGGGYLQIKDGKLVVSGSSGSYGEAPKRVITILKEAFPNLEVLDESPKENANIELRQTLEKIKDPIKSELYSVVMGDLAVRMGYDMTMLPKDVEGDLESAYMIYRSENGGSFGVDTLFVGMKNANHTVSVNEVAVTRWNMYGVSVKREGDSMVIEFTSNDEKHELKIPLKGIPTSEPFSDLNDAEKIILDMYKANQFIYKTATEQPKTWHGIIG